MSFTSFQQLKIDMMLDFSNDFKKLYSLIPKEFIHNYYYEKFLFTAADISSNIELVQQYSQAKNGHDIGVDIAFNIKKMDDGITAFFKYIASDKEGRVTDKRIMQITLDKEQTLTFHRNFGFWNFKNQDKERESTYDLVMKLSSDKSQVFVEHSTLGYYGDAPFKCFFHLFFYPMGKKFLGWQKVSI